MSHILLKMGFGTLLAAGFPAQAGFYDTKIALVNRTAGQVEVECSDWLEETSQVYVQSWYPKKKTKSAERNLSDCVFNVFSLGHNDALALFRKPGKEGSHEASAHFAVRCKADGDNPEWLPGTLSVHFKSEDDYHRDASQPAISLTYSDKAEKRYAFMTTVLKPGSIMVAIHDAAPDLEPEETKAPSPAPVSSSPPSSPPGPLIEPAVSARPLSMPPPPPVSGLPPVPALEQKVPPSAFVPLATIRNRSRRKIEVDLRAPKETSGAVPYFAVHSMDSQTPGTGGRPLIANDAEGGWGGFVLPGEQFQICVEPSTVTLNHPAEDILELAAFDHARKWAGFAGLSVAFTAPDGYGRAPRARLHGREGKNDWDELFQVDQQTGTAFPFTEVFSITDRPPAPPEAVMRLYVANWVERGKPERDAETARLYRIYIARLEEARKAARELKEQEEQQEEERKKLQRPWVTRPAQIRR